MRAISISIGTIALIAFAGPILAADTGQSDYTGQEARPIKSLSVEDIAALRKGEGMGMAKAAELNGYRGPLHVLALAGDLHLTESRVSRVMPVRNSMSGAALPLEVELIEREHVLDQLFAQVQITPERLTAETATIGEMQGRLRAVHLAAHLQTRAILSPEQVAQYNKLRGYDETSGSDHSRSTGHRH